METKDWITIGLSLLAVVSGLWAVYISNKRAPSQNASDSASANKQTMEAYEKVIGRLNVVELENERIIQALEGQATLSGDFQMATLIKDGEAPLINGKIVLKRDVSLRNIGTSSKH